VSRLYALHNFDVNHVAARAGGQFLGTRDSASSTQVNAVIGPTTGMLINRFHTVAEFSFSTTKRSSSDLAFKLLRTNRGKP
jgi:hypothetical protein